MLAHIASTARNLRPLIARGLSASSAAAVKEVELQAKGGSLRLTAAEGSQTWAAPAPSLTGYPPEVTRVAVVRSAFQPGSTAAPSLSQLVTKVNEQLVTLDPSVLTSRPVVDSYVRNGSRYVLEENSVCLTKYLKAAGVRALLEPNAKTLQASGASTWAKQSSNEILMVAPTGFESNLQAAQDNFFMASAKAGGLQATQAEVRAQVLREYAGLYHVLTEHAGVKVNLMSHDDAHGTPDACFPNNWFSTHVDASGGTLVQYPMKVPNRQLERRSDIISLLEAKGYYQKSYNMSGMEQESPPRYLEGTGCLVLDHLGKVAYVMLSERSDLSAAEEWAARLGYNEVVAYHSVDRENRPIYHTNVVQAVGTSFAVICADSVPDEKERKHLLQRLRTTREVIEISYDQMEKFCGNVIEVENDRGLPVLALSTQAYEAFTPDQIKTLEKHCAALHHAPVYTLEAVGGGGVRCCIAEVFN